MRLEQHVLRRIDSALLPFCKSEAIVKPGCLKAFFPSYPLGTTRNADPTGFRCLSAPRATKYHIATGVLLPSNPWVNKEFKSNLNFVAFLPPRATKYYIATGVLLPSSPWVNKEFKSNLNFVAFLPSRATKYHITIITWLPSPPFRQQGA